MLREVCKVIRGGPAEGRFAKMLGQSGKVTTYLGSLVVWDGTGWSRMYCIVQHGF